MTCQKYTRTDSWLQVWNELLPQPLMEVATRINSEIWEEHVFPLLSKYCCMWREESKDGLSLSGCTLLVSCVSVLNEAWHSWLSTYCAKSVTGVIYKVLTVTSSYSECNKHRWISMKTIVRKETRTDSIWVFLIRVCQVSAVPSAPKWGLSISAKLFTWQYFL